MAFCPTCGNLLNGVDPNFCDYCQKAVAGPASESGVEPNNSASGGTEGHGSPGVLHRCPSCGKLFAGEVINSQEIDSSDILKKDIQPQVHFAYRYRNPTAIAPTDYVYKTTRETYRCKYCQFEWSNGKVDRVVMHSRYDDEDRQYWDNRD